MSITGSFKSKIGTVQVEVDDGGMATTVEISEVGKLKYEFDLVPDKPEVDAVQSLYNKIDIEIFQHDINQNDLYERLRTNLIGQAGAAVNVTIDGDVFLFFIQLNDVSLSEKDRIITLDCRVRYNANASVLEVFDRIDTEDATLLKTFLPDPDNPSETLDCTGVADWIDAAMREVFLNEYDSVIHSAETDLEQNYESRNYTSFSGGIPNLKAGLTMVRMTNPPFGGLEERDEEDQTIQQGFIQYTGSFTFVGSGFEEILESGMSIELLNTIGQSVGFWIVDTVTSDTQFTITTDFAPPNIGFYLYRPFADEKGTEKLFAIDALKELAAIEGSIFGSGFGQNFFINRLERQEIVNLPWDDVVEMNADPFYNPLGGGLVRQVARTYSDVEDNTKNEGTDTFGIWPVTLSGGDWEMPVITDGKSQLQEIPGNDTRINLRLAPGYPFLNKGLGQPTQSRILGRYTSPRNWKLDFAPALALCRAGLNSIKKALSSDGSGDYLEFEIFDAKRIKPWNLVRFTGAPAKYSNKIFRPTSLEYDVVNDTVVCKAYEIVEVASPTNEITVIGNTHSSGSIVEGAEAIMVSGNSASSGEVVTGDIPSLSNDRFWTLQRYSVGDADINIVTGLFNYTTGAVNSFNEVLLETDLGKELYSANKNDWHPIPLPDGTCIYVGIDNSGINLFKFDTNLTLLAEYSLTDIIDVPSNSSFDNKVQADIQGNIYVSGITEREDVIGGSDRENGSIWKFDSDLNLVWKSDKLLGMDSLQLFVHKNQVLATHSYLSSSNPDSPGGATFWDIPRITSINKSDGVIYSQEVVQGQLDPSNPRIYMQTGGCIVDDGRVLILLYNQNGGSFENSVAVVTEYGEIEEVTLVSDIANISAVSDSIDWFGQFNNVVQWAREGVVYIDTRDEFCVYNYLTKTIVSADNFSSSSNVGDSMSKMENGYWLVSRYNNTGLQDNYVIEPEPYNEISDTLSIYADAQGSWERKYKMPYDNWQLYYVGGSPPTPDPSGVSGTTHASGSVQFDSKTLSVTGETASEGVTQRLKLAAPPTPETKNIIVAGETSSSGEVSTSVT